MNKLIYPGTFDPVTRGHTDIIKRGALLCDTLVIGVLNNRAKKPTFSVDERIGMLLDVTADIPGIEIKSFEGLSVDFAERENADAILRGLRSSVDFEYEIQIANFNNALAKETKGIETVFLMTSPEYSYISSTGAKEAAMFGGDISRFVPNEVIQKINDKFNNIRSR